MENGLMLAVTLSEPTLLETVGTWIWTIVSVGAGLTFVIFVHELGHFLVAKACGVKCEKFYVGFDFFEVPIPFTGWKIPRSLVKFQWGETEYGIGSLPLGGYVKMLGQDDDPRNAEQEAERIRAVKSEATAAGSAGQGPSGVPQPAELDPRSYPAKSVPARMAIISAGVVMNLIFAVILAAIAFKLGVEETPAIVGGTTPGGAAWTEGIEPGSKVIQIGRGGKPYEFLRWEDFRATAVLNNGRDLALLVRQPDGQEVWHEVRPTPHPETKHPMIGIAQPRSRRINIFPDAFRHLNPAASPPLVDYDLIVEVDGQKISSGSDFSTYLAQHPQGPLTLKVERREKTADGTPKFDSQQPPEVITTTVQPRPMRELGLAMKIGPIVAVREGSPAANVGIKPGDKLLEINGESLGDPLSLSQRLTPDPGSSKSVMVTIERAGKQGERGSRQVLELIPELPRQSPLLQSPLPLASNPIAIEPLGLAFTVLNEVAEVDPEGPAGQAGLAAGDVIQKVEFVWSGGTAQGEQLMQLVRLNLVRPWELKPGKSGWPEIASAIQFVFPDTRVKVTWKRGTQELTKEMLPRDSTVMNETRGILLYVDEEPHVAAHWGEALQLGFRETVEQVKQVLTILHSLVTGRISATNLSGPPGIIMAAASFASAGISSLLIFLTILSANLAVINFLPIPALDGGHMLFLAAEWIRGKPVDERLQMRLTVAGVICLLSLMVFATAMDIGRLAEMIQRWFS